MMRYIVNRARGPLTGTLRVPGDKSISHRAVLFASMARGTSHLSGVLDSADVRSTIAAVRALGARVDLAPDPAGTALSGSITGWGDRGPSTQAVTIDCGNSGTTARLLLGALAGWPVDVTMQGDASLSRRPMKRVTIPLAGTGAEYETTDGHLPLRIRGTSGPRPLDYESPVASAQVKSAVLLSGLCATGTTRFREPACSRDHTERMLPLFGVPVTVFPDACVSVLTGPVTLHAADVAVPADPSSAAFPVLATLLVPGSAIMLRDVSLNPTRIGFVRVLERMGARIEVTADASRAGEPAGSIRVAHTPGLRAVVVDAGEVPSLIDEIPVLAVAAAAATGTTRFEGVGELRVKESDRLAAILDGLAALGVEAHADGDALLVSGTDGAAFPLVAGSARFDSLGDHRLAMVWAVAGLAGAGECAIDRFEAVDVSYPDFVRDLASIGAW